MTDNLFTDDHQIDETKNYLEDLVGEGKKYKDAEALAKAVLHKDRHISTIEGENKTFRDELKVRTTLEEFLDKMKTQEPQQTNRETPPDEKRQDSANQLDIEELLEKKLTERDSRTAAQRNLQDVQKVLEQTYGSSWKTELRRKATELSVGEDFLNDLASTKPQAFLKLIEVDKTSEPELQNRTVRPSSESGKKNYAYYDKLRKEDPNRYLRPDVQNEMFSQAKLLGDAFYS